MDTTHKCAHPGCACTVEKDGEFCSQYCKDAGKDEIEIACDCQHSGCAI
jgi:hypothetical protein